MAEDGIFGTLNFEETQYGWVLNAGAEAATMYYHAYVESSISIAVVNQAWDRLQGYIHGPLQIASQITQSPEQELLDWVNNKLSDIEEAMHRGQMGQEYAFWQLGFASEMISLMANSRNDEEGHDVLEPMIHEQLETVNIKYPDVKIKIVPMLEEMWKDGRVRDPKHIKVSVRRIWQILKRQMIVLSVSAMPRGTNQIDLTRIHRTIQDQLASSNLRYRFERMDNCELNALKKKIIALRPAIIHFSGHGNKGLLAFEGATGELRRVNSDELVAILGDARQYGLRAVFMNACYSAKSASASAGDSMAQKIADAAGWTVGSECSLSVGRALKFTKKLYSGLARGRSVYDAFQNAKALVPDARFQIYEGE